MPDPRHEAADADREPDAGFHDALPGRVRIADQVVDLAAVRTNPGNYARLLARARAEVGYAYCLCRNPELKLVIRTRSERYHLAGWPETGDQHAVGCFFHKPEGSLSGRSLYTATAITEDANGVTIRLTHPLDTDLRQPRGVALPHGGEAASAQSTAFRTVGLLGLLHWLWEQTQLNQWHPRWRRTWYTCHARLAHIAADCAVNGLELTERLYVVPPYRPDTAPAAAQRFQRFSEQLGRRGEVERRGLILGEIKETAPTRYGTRYRLRHHRGALFSTAALTERVTRAYPAAFSAIASAAPDTMRRIALCVVERTAKGNLTITDMAVMLTNRAYLPADSSHEITMADHLIDAGRAFTKPVRYDAKDDQVFPDCVLTDTSPHTYVEVWGVRGRPSYERRKHAKQTHYREHHINVVEWDITRPLPDLRHHPST
ncbi:DUF1173 family protein [Actinomadura atramentaria]|uniref:DUF1173 family protein n=1 Tax=Actinomadura atramentaria TaxID=1990 RepID=UPI00036EB3A4|nr:DUF1173 family protein [Actinomadura atramentaria]